MSKLQRGDTIIEVLFATAIAALIIMMTITLMNRNLSTIQMATETTMVRQNIDSQAEVLRFLKDQYMTNRSVNTGYSKLWKDTVSTSASGHATTQASTFTQCTPPAKAFYLNQASDTGDQEATDVSNINVVAVDPALYKDLDSHARIGRGIWVEAVAPVFTTETVRYVDFHIRACWDPPYGGNKATLGTIVRQYYTVGVDVTEYGGSIDY